MDETQQAHHELDRLQGIVSRHESHMFALRGWLLAVIGGLLAAYYTANIDMSALVLRVALVGTVLLFLIVESRHVNLIEAVVERAGAIEKLIRDSRRSEGQPVIGWYDGPKVSESCQDGANRWWPRSGMTFVLNQPFYLVVIMIIVFTTISLPPKHLSTSATVSSEQSDHK